MRDTECVAFLQWALPRMGFIWRGFRKVRGQVCKRIGRRLKELGLESLDAYKSHLIRYNTEWQHLDGLCRVTISRFARDRGVFDCLITEVLPAIVYAKREIEPQPIRIWSAGCGGGEEPFSLAILAAQSPDPGLSSARLRLLATDADAHQIRRARRGVFAASSLRELSPEVRQQAFEQIDTAMYRLRAVYRRDIELCVQDLRFEMPHGPFELILCRNLAFTYFEPTQQESIQVGLLDRLTPGGYLVIGAHEVLPADHPGLVPLQAHPCILHRRLSPETGAGTDDA
jgi:chemotaxis protein methyltransferase CheR